MLSPFFPFCFFRDPVFKLLMFTLLLQFSNVIFPPACRNPVLEDCIFLSFPFVNIQVWIHIEILGSYMILKNFILFSCVIFQHSCCGRLIVSCYDKISTCVCNHYSNTYNLYIGIKSLTCSTVILFFTILDLTESVEGNMSDIPKVCIQELRS